MTPEDQQLNKFQFFHENIKSDVTFLLMKDLDLRSCDKST